MLHFHFEKADGELGRILGRCEAAMDRTVTPDAALVTILALIKHVLYRKLCFFVIGGSYSASSCCWCLGLNHDVGLFRLFLLIV